MNNPNEKTELSENIENFRQNENFPVASALIPKQARQSIHALYRFARNADEISDDPNISNEERKAQLQQILTALKGDESRDMPIWGREYFDLCKTGEMDIRNGQALI